MTEVERRGQSFARVARWHEAGGGLLWSWRAQVRRTASLPAPVTAGLPALMGAARAAAELRRPVTPTN